MPVPADQQVLQQGRIGKEFDVLKRARNAEAGDFVSGRVGNIVAVEDQLAFRGVVDPADQVEDRCLSLWNRAAFP